MPGAREPTVRHPERWSVAAAAVPVADYVTAFREEAPGLQAFDQSLFGGGPDEVGLYVEPSPLTYVDRVRAPVLIIADDNDSRGPDPAGAELRGGGSGPGGASSNGPTVGESGTNRSLPPVPTTRMAAGSISTSARCRATISARRVPDRYCPASPPRDKMGGRQAVTARSRCSHRWWRVLIPGAFLA